MGVQDYLNKVIESALHYPVTFSGDKKAILNRWLVKAEIVDVLNENGVDPYISENGIVISENEADNLSDEEIESNWRYYISDHERSFYHYNSPEKLFKNACEKGKEKMVYCLCNIFSNDDKEVLVHISTNLPSPIRVWINGELCVSGNPNYFAKNSAFIFKLNKGNNAVLVERSMFVRNRMLSIATRFFTFVVTPFDEFISNKTNKRFLDRNVLNYLKFGYAIIPSKAFYQPGEKVSFIILPKSMPYSKNVPVKVTVKTALGRTVSTIFAEVLKVVSVETDDSVRGVISIIAEGNAGYKKKEIVNVFYGNFKEEKNKLIEKAMERQDSNEEMIKTFSEITDMYDMRTGLIKAGSETMHEYMYHQMFEACLNFERYVFKPNSGKKLSLFDVFKESVMVFDKSDIDGGYFIYNIYLPSNYSHNKEYALLVYMIFDDSMTRYPVHPYRIVREKSGDAIVLSFVTRWEYQWDYINEINIINVVNETLEKFNINRDRVYLIGICAGANRAFNLLCKIPDVFSAFINIAGTPIFDDKEPESLNLDNIRNTPIGMQTIYGI
ncbi:MAG: hypothetical protein GX194_09300 [Clostridium sp.]|nr:hypothetical protein [Clostridium sp.]